MPPRAPVDIPVRPTRASVRVRTPAVRRHRERRRYRAGANTWLPLRIIVGGARPSVAEFAMAEHHRVARRRGTRRERHPIAAMRPNAQVVSGVPQRLGVATACCVGWAVRYRRRAQCEHCGGGTEPHLAHRISFVASRAEKGGGRSPIGSYPGYCSHIARARRDVTQTCAVACFLLQSARRSACLGTDGGCAECIASGRAHPQ